MGAVSSFSFPVFFAPSFWLFRFFFTAEFESVFDTGFGAPAFSGRVLRNVLWERSREVASKRGHGSGSARFMISKKEIMLNNIHF